jgi:hypothetical protein
MIDKALTSKTGIEPDSIDHHNLMLSLLNVGLKKGLLTLEKVEEIQKQLMLLLSDTIMLYTHDQSSSIKTEIAQRIMQSILYVLDVGLMDHSAPEKAIDTLKNTGLEEIYLQGLLTIDVHMLQAKQLMLEIQENKLSVDMISYQESIENINKEFFREYDVRFDAHNAIASIDYPLLSDDMSWDGIVYIKNYLKKLKWENDFCNIFSTDAINMLLIGMEKKIGISYKELLTNISEMIFINAIGSVILGRSAYELKINETEYARLETTLKNITDVELLKLLDDSSILVLDEMNIIATEVRQYFLSSMNKIYPILKNAIRENSLSSLLVIEKPVICKDSVFYTAGRKLEDEQLRILVEELLKCDTGYDKAKIIKAEIHNIEDLLDVFNSFCIFDNEYAIIFNEIGDYSIAALVSEIMDQSPLAEGIAFEIEHLHNTENEIYWKEKLLLYLKACDVTKFNAIVMLAKNLKDNMML